MQHWGNVPVSQRPCHCTQRSAVHGVVQTTWNLSYLVGGQRPVERSPVPCPSPPGGLLTETARYTENSAPTGGSGHRAECHRPRKPRRRQLLLHCSTSCIPAVVGNCSCIALPPASLQSSAHTTGAADSSVFLAVLLSTGRCARQCRCYPWRCVTIGCTIGAGITAIAGTTPATITGITAIAGSRAATITGIATIAGSRPATITIIPIAAIAITAPTPVTTATAATATAHVEVEITGAVAGAVTPAVTSAVISPWAPRLSCRERNRHGADNGECFNQFIHVYYPIMLFRINNTWQDSSPCDLPSLDGGGFPWLIQ